MANKRYKFSKNLKILIITKCTYTIKYTFIRTTN